MININTIILYQDQKDHSTIKMLFCDVVMKSLTCKVAMYYSNPYLWVQIVLLQKTFMVFFSGLT